MLASLDSRPHVHCTSDVDVVVLEASDGVGGRVRTDVVDGYRLDRGFQVLLTAYPELHRQFDVEALDLQAFEPGALVWDGSQTRLISDPVRRPSTVFATAMSPVGTIPDKLRILRQRIQLTRSSAVALLRQEDGSTLEALEAQGFSSRMIEQFFRPLVGGIQLDPTLATSRRMFDVILRSMVQGDVAVPANGMGELLVSWRAICRRRPSTSIPRSTQ
ncbi:MAG: FAD-dependent oxidoreductase [Acidimicrobiales bacterium]